MTKKKHEELVEEIRKTHCKKCFFSNPRAEWMCDASIEICREQIAWDITHILSAVCDGESFGGLSLPDEIERVGLETPLARWIDDMVGVGADIFIALRGTGKEED